VKRAETGSTFDLSDTHGDTSQSDYPLALRVKKARDEYKTALRRKNYDF
jgi:hypothetical protein